MRIVGALVARDIQCTVVTFRLSAEFPQLPCRLHLIPLQKTASVGGLRAALRLKQVFAEQPVDVVHTFFETSDIFGGLVARLCGCRVLISSQRDMGIIRSSKHRRAYRVIRGLFYEFHAVSEEVRRHCITEMGLRPEKIRTIHNGVDLPPIRVIDQELRRTELGLPVGVPLIVCVGNIRYVKGIDVLVAAADRLRRTIPNAKFIIVGAKSEPEFSSLIESMIRQRGLEETIQLSGPKREILEILEVCDLFCMLSRSEGFSNALLEAMAVGLPCVVTNVGGNPEVVEHEINGFLVPNEDSLAASTALESLIVDVALRETISAAARRTVSERFTTAIMIDTLLDAYSRALEPFHN